MIFTTSKLSKPAFPSLPTAVYFIVFCSFFEGLYAGGLFTILPLYLVEILKFSQQQATLFFHVFCFFGSLFPLFVSLLGDSNLGKYRSILIIGAIYVIGSVTIDIASTPLIDYSNRRLLTCLGALAVCVGFSCGVIRTPFGGDQFTCGQYNRLSHFFLVSYFVDNLAGLTSGFVAPVLRHNYECFGNDNCFPLPFTFFGAMLLTAFVIFVAGRRFYVRKKQERIIIMDVINCSFYALREKMHSGEKKKKHWLDYAEDKFDKTLISDTKAAFEVLYLLLPVPVFWALDDQTGSTWVFQAMHMDGSLGWLTIKPDQMQLLDPLMTLLLVPLVDLLVYPLLAKCHLLEQPLQRLTTGGLLAAISFLLAALLQLTIQYTLPELPRPGTTQLRVFNGLNCDVRFINSPVNSDTDIPALDALEILGVTQEDSASYPVTFVTADNCYLGANITFSGNVTMQELQASSLFLHSHQGIPRVSQVPGFDVIDKTGMENPKLRILYNLSPFVNEITLTQDVYSKIYKLDDDAFSTPLASIIHTGKYTAMLGNASVSVNIELGSAGIYTLIVRSHEDTVVGHLITVTPPNSVHMLWQVPQYIVITFAEIMFTITSNELSYTQAPESMKSLISSVWRLTDAIGNIIIILVVYCQLFDNQVSQYMFFASIMVIAIWFFNYISKGYQYYVPQQV